MFTCVHINKVINSWEHQAFSYNKWGLGFLSILVAKSFKWDIINKITFQNGINTFTNVYLTHLYMCSLQNNSFSNLKFFQ